MFFKFAKKDVNSELESGSHSQKDNNGDINIGISESRRLPITEGLSSVLADTYILYLKTQNYHWNVTGVLFQTLHTMFETQYNELAIAIDTLAERIRTLGVHAPGSFEQFMRLSTLSSSEPTEDSQQIPNALQMLQNLNSDHEEIIQNIRSVFILAEKGEDQATLDILVQRIQSHEKTAWILRSFNP